MKHKWPVTLVASLLLLTGHSTVASADSVNVAGAHQQLAATVHADVVVPARPEGWTEETHSNSADPNFEVVFSNDRINNITIDVAPEDWEAMQADLSELLASGDTELGRSGLRKPMWVPATIEFDGRRWTNVGVRFKGGLTLREAWSAGSLKLPLKLDFDQFEDQFPEIQNQRFYGFKQLSMANGLHDDSFLRDTLAYDLLEEAGMVAAQTAHYNVFINYGRGWVGLGLYTMIEVIEDTVVKRYFGGDRGNIYEADGPAASLAAGSFPQIEESFHKENNEDEADWSDIQALYSVLHSRTRETNPGAWRASLEEIFDVDVFLKWLAIGSALDHWDTYGAHPHNYYLYNDPGTGRLTWISWDHNLVLGDGNVTVDRADIGADWPLVRYLLDDPTYHAVYFHHLEETVNGVFDPSELAAKYQETARLLEPHAAMESRPQPFQTAVETLIQTVRDRVTMVNDFLNSP